jgi:hypothetical protein
METDEMCDVGNLKLASEPDEFAEGARVRPTEKADLGEEPSDHPYGDETLETCNASLSQDKLTDATSAPGYRYQEDAPERSRHHGDASREIESLEGVQKAREHQGHGVDRKDHGRRIEGESPFFSERPGEPPHKARYACPKQHRPHL